MRDDDRKLHLTMDMKGVPGNAEVHVEGKAIKYLQVQQVIVSNTVILLVRF